jgi:hypothetical protein
MEFNLFGFWYGQICFGFQLLSFDTYREDEMVYSLIGFAYDREDKIFELDIFWKCFEFKLGRA